MEPRRTRSMEIERAPLQQPPQVDNCSCSKFSLSFKVSFAITMAFVIAQAAFGMKSQAGHDGWSDPWTKAYVASLGGMAVSAACMVAVIFREHDRDEAERRRVAAADSGAAAPATATGYGDRKSVV